MATTAQYLESLKNDKHNLVLALQDRGIEASDSETFTELIPKLESESTFTIPAAHLFQENIRLDMFDDLAPRIAPVTDISFMCKDATEVSTEQVLTLINLCKFGVTNSLQSFSGITCPLSLDLSDSNFPGGGSCFEKAIGLTYYKAAPGLLYVGKLFSGCTNLKKVDLSLCTYFRAASLDGTSNFHASAIFFNCTSLEEIILPSNLENPLEIEGGYSCGSIFANCTALKRITNIERGLSFIKGSTQSSSGTPSRMFYNCINLVQDNGVLDLSNTNFTTYNNQLRFYEVFTNCKSLRKILIGTLPGNAYLDQWFVGCDLLEEIVFTKMSTLSKINQLFVNCPNLKRVDLSTITVPGTAITNLFYNNGSMQLDYLDISGLDFTTNPPADINTFLSDVSNFINCDVIVQNQVTKDWFLNNGLTKVYIKGEELPNEN